MADYTSITIAGNTATDAAPTWGATMAFAGSAGANELRFGDTGDGNTITTPSASWVGVLRSLATAPLRNLYIFTTNVSGYVVATYDGTNGKANVLRMVFDALGTFASVPRWTAFQDTALTTPTPGTQVSSPTTGSNIINGSAGDTGSTSYLKGNGYGSGMTNAGAQETPAAGAAGTTLLVTSGTAGSLASGAGAWLVTWQSLQGFTQYVTLAAIPKPTTAFFYYFTLAMFMGPNMLPGIMPFPPVVLDYTFI